MHHKHIPCPNHCPLDVMIGKAKPSLINQRHTKLAQRGIPGWPTQCNFAPQSTHSSGTIGETIGWNTIQANLGDLGAGHHHKALTIWHLDRLPSSSPSSTFLPLPRVVPQTTHLLVGRLFGDSSELSQGILLASTAKPTPDEGIQNSIASSDECQHLGLTVPSMKYL